MVKFIAEVSSNHAQDLGRSLAFVDAAADCGFDAVKFQLFRVKELFAPEIREPEPTAFQARRLGITGVCIGPIARRCAERGVEFSCTPFYLEAVAELEPYAAFYKVASYELLWGDLLTACAKTGKPVIISTGMAIMPEIKAAVDTLRAARASDITVLHCVSAYPSPPEQSNLSAIAAIRRETGAHTGWSDHSRSPAVIERAVHHWNAGTIELHLDLDGTGEEYHTGHCWLPEEIAPVIARIRLGLTADGKGFKEPVPAELPDREWRADPSDGLRPFRHVRTNWVPA